jgi:hypothetical protein
MNHKQTMNGAMTAALLLALSTPAAAMDKSRARDAIAEADADIQAAWAAGAANKAPDAHSKALTSLDLARHQLRKGKERRAFYTAREADAYARLALATAQQR